MIYVSLVVVALILVIIAICQIYHTIKCGNANDSEYYRKRPEKTVIVKDYSDPREYLVFLTKEQVCFICDVLEVFRGDTRYSRYVKAAQGVLKGEYPETYLGYVKGKEKIPDPEKEELPFPE